MNVYYRPQFTCGAFNKEAVTALMYNTANGTCHYFEGISAVLVRELLSCPREQQVNTARIAELTDTTVEQVEEFLRGQLMPLGLIHDHVYTDAEWQQYHQDNLPSIAAVGYAPKGNYDESRPLMHRVSIQFELTYACSERCLHCFNEGAARSDLHEENRLSHNMLRLEEYKRIIDEMVELGIPDVTVTGGDPFSYPDCWALLDYLHEKNMAVNLFTNALALNTPEKIRRVARLGLRQFHVSIYSSEATVHDQITRREGSWQKTTNALREMSKWPVPLNVKTPAFRLNSRTYYGVRKLCHELCAESQLSGMLQQGTDGDISILEELMTRPDAYRIMLMDTRMDACVSKHEGKPDGFELGKYKGMPCSAIQTIIINPSGIAKPCANLPIKLGNMHKDSLKQVLENEIRDKLINGDQRVMTPACGKHDYCSYCNAPCFAGQPISWTADGLPVFEKPAPVVCDAVKIRMEVGRMLQQGIDPLGGKTVEECLAALPVEQVPVFRKKIVD